MQEIVASMAARFGKVNRVWVMDRGMVSAENIAWLNSTGRRYVIGTARAELKRWAKQIADPTDWRQIREDVEVKICRGPQASETFLLCRSASRIDQSTRALDRGTLERQIGRLLERNTRAAARYAISIIEDPRGGWPRATNSGVKLKWTVQSQWDDWAAVSEGTYILRSNIPDWSEAELWRTYIQLSEAEAAFRIHKSDLCGRPIWHHKEGRIKAHILICFLAYVLWKTLQQWQSRAGRGDSPRTILTEFSRIHAADIVLPLADKPGRELRLRCVVRPEPAQAFLLQRLGLTLPERLRLPQTNKM